VALNTQRKEGKLDTLTNQRIIHERYIEYVSDLMATALIMDRLKNLGLWQQQRVNDGENCELITQ
jgi:hypothetical protein